ncbi:DsbE family thiol:disulfide interchange protein [Nitratireductor sp. XY-223]|uniref:DsbE family thiol:disulfide interchange protein n=1 Tax=Nitratireductor sp. XY-223 TaxID=2561926 RepID=UPI0010AA63DD|nr:DsbE family thiol:disulfide interchange protein [Nitratireductor sp. XY-223]
MSSETGNNGASPARRSQRRFIAFVPLISFAVLAVIFYSQLTSGRDVSEVPSVLIGTAAPALDLPPLEGLKSDGAQIPALTDAQVEGKVTLVNIWASWCLPCRQEHPLLMALAEDGRINLVGINYKDQTSNALRFLGELGNPYTAVGIDPRGVAAIDWGVYGIPETFLLDSNGTIVFKQIGPFTPDAVRDRLMPAIEKALSVPAKQS